jgi:O-antigen biosynthesis protein
MIWPRGPRLELDWPLAGAELTSESLEVSGWAFSRKAPIAKVEASLGGASPVLLAYGTPRPDVALVHGCQADCGFVGRIALADVASGRLRLRVNATDARGARRTLDVDVVRRDGAAAAFEERLEVEEVAWRGCELEVLGFALPAPGSEWRSIVVEVGAFVGAARRGRSRPELGSRFPRTPGAARSGFHFRGRVPEAGEVALVARTSDGRGVRRSLPRSGDPGQSAAVPDLARLLEGLREDQGRDPSLLDASGLALADRFPRAAVATPLDADLPYALSSFDVVALGSHDKELLSRARPLASRAVVVLPAAGPLRVAWEAVAEKARLPSVSVVIPVFNQSALTDACLRSVVDTWPESLDGEVLVVDDGSTDDTAQTLRSWSERESRVRALPQKANRGFIHACNAGARAARGEILVFLNNDTLAQPGWLPPLLATLGRPGAGAVGGKLLNADGSLQEAGGVIFADGDGCNFGKGDPEPGHPIFDHVREVDYCSGALLATPRALFLEMGGFDEAFAPAYYEDADYAFRLRQRGLRVYYQPASAVVHLEGMTSGRDLTKGVKRHQALNRATFVSRWAESLRSRPLPPQTLGRAALHRLRVREAGARRALMVLPTMPELDREGGSRRAYHLIELLLEAGWAVSVVVENATGGERYAHAVQQLGAAFYAGPMTRGAGSEYLEGLGQLLELEHFELALFAFWHVAERHLPAMRALQPDARVVVDSIDLHFLREARSAFGRPRSDAPFEALVSRQGDEYRRELNAYGAADAVLAVSRKEAGWIDDLVGRPGHGLCVPLLEDSPGAPRPLVERRGLVFLGNFRHPPNVDALAFLAEVLARLDPAILHRHPLDIVGNALEAHMLGALRGRPGVRAVGWVPAVEPYLGRARVALVPLRQGAGTKAKMIQSLLAGTACVSTSLGVEGMGLTHGREVLVADDPAAFAAAIEQLVHDDEAWLALSSCGRQAIERDHGREAVRSMFHAALDAVLGRR